MHCLWSTVGFRRYSDECSLHKSTFAQREQMEPRLSSYGNTTVVTTQTPSKVKKFDRCNCPDCQIPVHNRTPQEGPVHSENVRDRGKCPRNTLRNVTQVSDSCTTDFSDVLDELARCAIKNGNSRSSNESSSSSRSIISNSRASNSED